MKIEFTHKKEFETGSVAACSYLWFVSTDTVWWNTLPVIKGALSSKVQREQLLQRTASSGLRKHRQLFSTWLGKRTNKQSSKWTLSHSTSTNGSTELKQPKFRSESRLHCTHCLTSAPLRQFNLESVGESQLLYFVDLTKYWLPQYCNYCLTGFENQRLKVKF